LGAAEVLPPDPRITSLQKNIRVEVLDIKSYKIKKAYENKYQNNYAGAFMIGSFSGAESFGKGPMIRALLAPAPFSPWAAPPLLELPAGAVFFGGIVFAPFDGSTGVEGIVNPTPASSP